MWSRKVSLRSGNRYFKALKVGSERSLIAFCSGVVVAVSSFSDTWRAVCDMLEAVRASAPCALSYESLHAQHHIRTWGHCTMCKQL